MIETPVLRSLRWMGNAKKVLQSFPKAVQKTIGYELQVIQFGGMPRDAKPFKGAGAGVFELAIRYNTDAYRTVCAVQLGKHIYVLHAFQKKSKQGIKTPKEEIEIIKSRLKEAREVAKHDR